MSEFNKQETVDEQEMSNSIAVTNHNLMGADEARKLTSDILTNEQNSKRALYRIGVEKGYLAMGYKDFKSYVVSELRITPNAAGKQFAAACAAATLFGEEYIGVYSDASLRLLSPFSIQTQVMVIQYLQEKYDKKNNELPSPKEFTVQSITEAICQLGSKAKNLLKQVKESLGREFYDDNFTEYAVESLAIFEPYNEQEYIDKHGFSRWDKRSLNLLRGDELLNIDNEDDLELELLANWSLRELLNHSYLYHPEIFEEAQYFATKKSYILLINLLIKQYFPSNKSTVFENDDDAVMNGDDSDDSDGNDDIYSIDELMENPFFADAETPLLLHEHIKLRKLLKKKVAQKLNKGLKRKNPKAGYLIAVSESMNAEELDLARCFFEFKYYEQTKNEESDCEDVQSDDFDFGN